MVMVVVVALFCLLLRNMRKMWKLGVEVEQLASLEPMYQAEVVQKLKEV